MRLRVAGGCWRGTTGVMISAVVKRLGSWHGGFGATARRLGRDRRARLCRRDRPGDGRRRRRRGEMRPRRHGVGTAASTGSGLAAAAPGRACRSSRDSGRTKRGLAERLGTAPRASSRHFRLFGRDPMRPQHGIGAEYGWSRDWRPRSARAMMTAVESYQQQRPPGDCASAKARRSRRKPRRAARGSLRVHRPARSPDATQSPTLRPKAPPKLTSD